MAWVRLDDKRATNPKLLRAGFEARGLDEAMICWAAMNETDGAIAEAAVTMIAAGHGCKNWRRLAGALVDVGRWEPTPDGWQIHDFLEFNPSKQSRDAERDRKREAGRIGGLRSGQARTKQPAEPETKQPASEIPNPRPGPARPEQQQQPGTHAGQPPVRAAAAAELAREAFEIILTTRRPPAKTNPAAYRKAILAALEIEHADRLAGIDWSEPWTPQALADWLEPAPSTVTNGTGERRDYDRPEARCEVCHDTRLDVDERGDAVPCPACSAPQAVAL